MYYFFWSKKIKAKQILMRNNRGSGLHLWEILQDLLLHSSIWKAAEQWVPRPRIVLFAWSCNLPRKLFASGVSTVFSSER